MKKAAIGTAAMVGIFVGLEFLAPGHWGFFTGYLGDTAQSAMNTIAGWFK